jgi:16S rRNA (guanine(966)-N(2))-methyltransferase RsmD
VRVIAGTSRGRRLSAFAGSDVRPTPDRVREALFSILQSKLGSFAGVRVLDLFAGSGALAIEALSRGADSACLVEQATESVKLIRENLERCRISSMANLIKGDAWQILPTFSAGSFDLVFVDPPYGQNLASRALVETDRLKLLSADGILCAETGSGEFLPETVGQLRRIDQRRYGSIMIHFYSHSPEGLT